MIHALEWIIAMLRDPGPLIAWGGYPALALIIFLETGAMVFCLPGDSLLVVAGLYAAKGDLNIAALIALLTPMAILGDSCSYAIGKYFGTHLLSKQSSWFFKSQHLEAAHLFYKRHGGRTIVIARFMPLIRTFVPVVAGIASMPYRQFVIYNVAGGFGWIASMTCIGYFLGTRFPTIPQHIEKVIIVIIVLSLMPALIEVIRTKWRASRVL